MSKEFTITLAEGHDMKLALKALEGAYLEYAYKAHKYNQLQTAKSLGMSRGCFRYKLKEYFGDLYI